MRLRQVSPLLKWRIYGDGWSFSNEDGAPEDAPQDGIICIVQYDSTGGRYLLRYGDFYSFRDGEWMAHDHDGAVDQMKDRGYLKQGRAIRRDRFFEIVAEAESDPDFPPRSAYRPGERPDRETVEYAVPLD